MVSFCFFLFQCKFGASCQMCFVYIRRCNLVYKRARAHSCLQFLFHQNNNSVSQTKTIEDNMNKFQRWNGQLEEPPGARCKYCSCEDVFPLMFAARLHMFPHFLRFEQPRDQGTLTPAGPGHPWNVPAPVAKLEALLHTFARCASVRFYLDHFRSTSFVLHCRHRLQRFSTQCRFLQCRVFFMCLL